MIATADDRVRGGLAGVVVALAAEAASAQLLAGRGWRLRVSGIGAESARREAELLLASGVRRLLVWGTAGGLSPTLRPGTLIVPEAVIDVADGRSYAVSPSWRARLAETLAPLGFPFVGGGLLASSATPLATAAAKAELAARSGALMVDMESAAVAAVAAREQAEFAVVRALADPAGLALAPAVLAAVGASSPSRAVLQALLHRPQDLPAVLRLGRAFASARKSLAGAAQALAEVRGL